VATSDEIQGQSVGALEGQDADYIEVRIEERETSRIRYRGRELEDIGRSTSLGGNARALVSGGWGFVSFNEIGGLRDKVMLAVKQAGLVGKVRAREFEKGEENRLSPVEPVVDTVVPRIERDPAAVPLAQKNRLLDEYNKLIWATPKIQTSVIAYGDSKKTVTFANSEGSYIEQTKVDLSLRLMVIAREDGDIQQAVLSMGSSGDFGAMEGTSPRGKGSGTARRSAPLRAPC